MSVKRTSDPAGLFPDHITVDCDDPQPGDEEAIRELFEAGSPTGRIERLRRHGQLVPLAKELASDLGSAGGLLDDKLALRLVYAEHLALYLDAAPAAMEKRRRKARASALTDADVMAAIKKHDTLVAAADYLGISRKQLYNRRRKICGG